MSYGFELQAFLLVLYEFSVVKKKRKKKVKWEEPASRGRRGFSGGMRSGHLRRLTLINLEGGGSHLQFLSTPIRRRR